MLGSKTAWRFIRDALVLGRSQRPHGILVYDALQAAPALEYNEAGYLNFGLWRKGMLSAIEASENLLARLAARAGLSHARRVLDVGFGTGAQSLFFARITPAAIVGINQSVSQTAVARDRVARAGLVGRVDLRLGDATQLDFHDNQFDVVTCVEAAFHFAPRERFFREAYRVLASGGRLVLADILPSSGDHWSRTLFWDLFHRFFYVPLENRISLEAYRAQLERCGFDVRVEVVTDHVYVPFFANCMTTYRWLPAIGFSQLLAGWFRWRPPCEYVLVVATKVADGRTPLPSADAQPGP